MKADATLEDFKRRELCLVQYIERQIGKLERQQGFTAGGREAYKDILFKLTKE